MAIKSEIRKAYLLNKYVIITPGRLKRPRDIKEQTIIKRTKSCPFCPDKVDEKNVVDKISISSSVAKADWKVLSIKNMTLSAFIFIAMCIGLFAIAHIGLMVHSMERDIQEIMKKLD